MATSRFNFEIDDELKARVQKWPRGIRASVLRRLLEYGCDIFEEHGEVGLGAVLAGKFHLESDAIVKKPKA